MPVTSLTAIFGSAPDKPGGDEGESEKLLNLYWNRAELKKEFAELRSEKIRLQQRINEQQGAAARSLQQLEQLESLLLDPAKVYSTVTYFQLRAINARCTAKLAKFAELLKQQREQRIHSRLVDEWNQLRQQKVARHGALRGAQEGRTDARRPAPGRTASLGDHERVFETAAWQVRDREPRPVG